MSRPASTSSSTCGFCTPSSRGSASVCQHGGAQRLQAKKSTPLGRVGDPEDVAAAVVYLASPAGGYLTGKILEVDGGIIQPNLDLGIPDL
jgi:NAD(P)-dependent dehydrogenase (short-subunit alcohol dehydrogenase family)